MHHQNKFFVWNNDFYVGDVRLGDDLDALVNSGTIVISNAKEEKEYLLQKNRRIQFTVRNEKIKGIHYSRETLHLIVDLDLSQLPYPETEHACALLAKKFTPLSDILSIAKLKESHRGDFLWVVFADYKPRYVAIFRVD